MAASSISGKTDPLVRQIAVEDVFEALRRGWSDFKRAPTLGLLLGIACAAIGLGIVALLFQFGMPYFAYPLAAGFALVCPFIACGLYEVSRRLEQGETLALGAIARRVLGRSEVRWMGFMTLFVLIMWMYQVRFLMAVFLGLSAMSASLFDFFHTVFSTSDGLWFFAIGNVVGAALSVILFSLSVVSFPLVLDRDVDFVTAMITSVQAVLANPLPMLVWGAIIAALLVLSALTGFLGLLVTLPLLGHATWHLYRRVIG